MGDMVEEAQARRNGFKNYEEMKEFRRKAEEKVKAFANDIMDQCESKSLTLYELSLLVEHELPELMHLQEKRIRRDALIKANR